MKQERKRNWINLMGAYRFIIPFLIILFFGEFIFFQWHYRDIIFLNDSYKSSRCDDMNRLMEIYRKSLEEAPLLKDTKTSYCLFSVLLQSGKKTEAVNVLGEIVTAHPQNKMLIFQLAIELFNLERYTESEKHLRSLLNTSVSSKSRGGA